MSIIKELSSLHVALKSILIQLMLIPILFVSIYMFNYDFFIKNNIVVLLFFTATLSLLISNLTSVPLDFVMKKDTENKYDYLEISVGSVLLNFLYIALIDFIFYSLLFFKGFQLPFYYHTILYLVPFFCISVVAIIEKLFYFKAE